VVETFGPRGDCTGRRGNVIDRRFCIERDEHVHTLCTAGLDRAHQPRIGQDLADQLGGADGKRKGVGGRRVEI
jgi:hypothetical protein